MFLSHSVGVESYCKHSTIHGGELQCVWKALGLSGPANFLLCRAVVYTMSPLLKSCSETVLFFTSAPVSPLLDCLINSPQDPLHDVILSLGLRTLHFPSVSPMRKKPLMLPLSACSWSIEDSGVDNHSQLIEDIWLDSVLLQSKKQCSSNSGVNTATMNQFIS